MAMGLAPIGIEDGMLDGLLVLLQPVFLGPPHTFGILQLAGDFGDDTRGGVCLLIPLRGHP